MPTIPIYVLAGQSNASLAGMDRLIDAYVTNSGGAAEFVKVAVNGTSLIGTPRGPDWDPDSEELFVDLVNAILAAMGNAIAQGGAPEVHVLWVQGEGYHGARPDPYADKLTQFINELRAEIDMPDTVFTISLIPYDNTTRTAQLTVAATVADVLVIDPVDPGFWDDGVHYDRQTREGIATQWLTMVSSPGANDSNYVRLVPYSGIVAEATRDIVTGFAYQDFVFTSSSARAQWVTSFSGDDVITTGAGNDRILTGGNDDVIYAGDGDDYVDAGVHEDTLYGEGGNDVLLGGTGADVVYGGTGNDSIRGGRQNDQLFGGDGDDTIQGDQHDDLIDGGAGNDMVSYASNTMGVTVNLSLTGAQLTSTETGYDTLVSIENINGSEFDDHLTGNTGINRIIGRQGADRLAGLSGNDSIDGAGGNDVITGGAGRDMVYGGGGADRFVFDDGHFSGTTNATADAIRDFNRVQGDRIDLRPVDANTTTAADDAFAFIGTAAFSGVAGELRYDIVGANAMVFGDLDGDGKADFAIRVDNVSEMVLSDFWL